MTQFNDSQYNDQQYNSAGVLPQSFVKTVDTFSSTAESAKTRIADLVNNNNSFASVAGGASTGIRSIHNTVSSFSNTVYSMIDYDTGFGATVTSFTDTTRSTVATKFINVVEITKTSYTQSVTTLNSRVNDLVRVPNTFTGTMFSSTFKGLSEFENLSSYAYTATSAAYPSISTKVKSITDTVSSKAVPEVFYARVSDSFTGTAVSKVDYTSLVTQMVSSYAGLVDTANNRIRRLNRFTQSFTGKIAGGVDTTLIKNVKSFASKVISRGYKFAVGRDSTSTVDIDREDSKTSTIKKSARKVVDIVKNSDNTVGG